MGSHNLRLIYGLETMAFLALGRLSWSGVPGILSAALYLSLGE